MTPPKFKIAFNKTVVSSFGNKPDMGQGLPYEQKTETQKKTAFQLTKNLRNYTLTAEEIAHNIDQGYTLTAQFGGYAYECKGDNCNKYHEGTHRLKVNFKSAQHLGFDFDTLETEEEVLAHPLVKGFGSIIYYTVSSQPEDPKMRVIFLLSEPIKDRFLYERLQVAFMHAFGGKTDPSTKDCSRLFYGRKGTNPIVTEKVLPLAVAMKILSDFEAEKSGDATIACFNADLPAMQESLARANQNTVTFDYDAIKEATNAEQRLIDATVTTGSNGQNTTRQTRPEINFGRHNRVTRSKPCPICNHPDNCNADAEAIYCRRYQSYSVPAGWKFIKEGADGGGLFLKEDTTTDSRKTKEFSTEGLVKINPNLSAKTDQSQKQAEADQQGQCQPEPYAIADLNTLDQVYTTLLSQLTLNKKHETILTDPKGKRQLSLDRVRAMGIKSVPTRVELEKEILPDLTAKFGIETLLGVPGFFRSKNGQIALNLVVFRDELIPAMLTPVKDHGKITAIEIRPDYRGKDGKGAKIFWLTSAKQGGPSARVRAMAFGEPDPKYLKLFVTEGCLKAEIAAFELGCEVISVWGVGSWASQGVVELCKEMGKGKEIIVAFDEDTAEPAKTNTNRAKYALATALYQVGLRVKIAGWNGTVAKGLDDLLLAGGEFLTEYFVPNMERIPVDRIILKEEMIFNPKNGRYYLPDITSTKRLLLLQAGRGQGKTEMIARYINRLPDEATVLDLNHLVSLSKDHCRRLGTQDYQADYKDKDNYDGMEEAERLSIVINSLIHFKNTGYKDFIPLDEVNQVIRRLTSIDKVIRQTVIATLRAQLEASGQIFGMSADIDLVTYNFFLDLFGSENIEVVVCNYLDETLPPVYQHTTQTEELASLRAYLTAGGRAYIACNTKAEVERIEEMVKTDFPKLNYLTFHSGNAAAKQEELKDLMQTCLDRSTDLLICSPTVQTGISLNVPHFDRTYLFGTCNDHCNDHRDLAQQMSRNRYAKEIHCYVQSKQGEACTDREQIKQDLIDKAHIELLAIRYDKYGKRQIAEHDRDYLNLLAEVKAENNRSHNNYAANFYAGIELDGYKVLPYSERANQQQDLEPPISKEAIKEAKTSRAAAQNRIKTERVDGILAAELVDYGKAKDLETKLEQSFLTKLESYVLEKYKINDYYNPDAKQGGVTEELIKFDQAGRGRTQVHNFLLLTTTQEENEIINTVGRDLEKVKDIELTGNYFVDFQGDTARKNALKKVWEILGITTDQELNGDFFRDNGMVATIREDENYIRQILGIKVKSNFEERPIEFVSSFLRLVGLGLDCNKKKVDGKTVRTYQLGKKKYYEMEILGYQRYQKLEQLKEIKDQKVQDKDE